MMHLSGSAAITLSSIWYTRFQIVSWVSTQQRPWQFDGVRGLHPPVPETVLLHGYTSNHDEFLKGIVSRDGLSTETIGVHIV
jgi:hypothetical protein